MSNHYSDPKWKKHHPKLRTVWNDMMRRCYNTACKAYKAYGAKGVTVYKQWREDRVSFCDWAMNNGWKPGLQIDKDLLGDGKIYSPDTCCFLTQLENLKHRAPFTFPERTNFVYKGEKRSVEYIAKDVGMNVDSLRSRLWKKKMSFEEAISIPLGTIPQKGYPTLFFDYKGEQLPLPEIAKRENMKLATLRSRIYHGATIEEAIKPLTRKSPSPHLRTKKDGTVYFYGG